MKIRLHQISYAHDCKNSTLKYIFFLLEGKELEEGGGGARKGNGQRGEKETERE